MAAVGEVSISYYSANAVRKILVLLKISQLITYVANIGRSVGLLGI